MLSRAFQGGIRGVPSLPPLSPASQAASSANRRPPLVGFPAVCPLAGFPILPLAGFPSFRTAVHGNEPPAAGFPTSRASVQANCHGKSDNPPTKAENPCTARQQLGKPAARSQNRCTMARQLGKPATSRFSVNFKISMKGCDRVLKDPRFLLVGHCEDLNPPIAKIPTHRLRGFWSADCGSRECATLQHQVVE